MVPLEVGPPELADLRDRAVGLRQRLDDACRSGAGSNFPFRPLFVEFSGTPKSGKSTCIDVICHFLRRTGFRVLAPTEGASKRTPESLKDDLVAFNAWSACYALQHVVEGLHDSEHYHIAILDRGLFDALVWFDLLASNEDLTQDQCQKVHQFLLLAPWRSVIDAVFLFRADPQTSLAREWADKLIFEPGRAMNENFLTQLNDAYTRVRSRYASLFTYFTEVDTSNKRETTPRSTAEEVVAQIIALCEERLS